MPQMNISEAIKAVLEFRSPDRMPRLEWGCWWDKTIDRWHGDGLDPRLRNVRWYAPGMPVIPAEGEIGDIPDTLAPADQ